MRELRLFEKLRGELGDLAVWRGRVEPQGGVQSPDWRSCNQREANGGE